MRRCYSSFSSRGHFGCLYAGWLSSTTIHSTTAEVVGVFCDGSQHSQQALEECLANDKFGHCKLYVVIVMSVNGPSTDCRPVRSALAASRRVAVVYHHYGAMHEAVSIYAKKLSLSTAYVCSTDTSSNYAVSYTRWKLQSLAGCSLTVHLC